MAVSLLLFPLPFYWTGLATFTYAPYLPIPRQVVSDVWACSPEGWPFHPVRIDVKAWPIIPLDAAVPFLLHCRCSRTPLGRGSSVLRREDFPQQPARATVGRPPSPGSTGRGLALI